MKHIKFIALILVTISVVACKSDNKKAKAETTETVEEQVAKKEKAPAKKKDSPAKKKRRTKITKEDISKVNTSGFVITPKSKREAGQFYTDLQKSLSLSNVQLKSVKDILFAYREKKQEMAKQGKWKGGENRTNRRELERATDKQIQDALGDELYVKYLAFDKKWNA